ncbi:MAG: DUF3298 and DUF4163 domain-containing protein [Candidatus Marinimicrobia bacterium]|nr:DUF3298 and DUF4163 domain-containing protein [Candidatus Neomarinimicrobiota bacterium]
MRSLQNTIFIKRYISMGLIIAFAIPMLAFSESEIFSSECFLTENDTLSPSMIYDLKAEKIEGLSDTSLLMFSDPETYFKRTYRSYCNDYLSLRNLYKEFPGSASIRHHFYDEYAEISYSDDNYYSIRFTQSSYTGGAHPNSWAQHWIIDKKTVGVVDFRDIFKDNAEESIKELTDKALIKQFKIKDLSKIVFNPDYQVSKDMYFIKKGIVFQYDAYEIAPYVYGSIEVFIPYKKLKNLMK